MSPGRAWRHGGPLPTMLSHVADGDLRAPRPLRQSDPPQPQLPGSGHFRGLDSGGPPGAAWSSQTEVRSGCVTAVSLPCTAPRGDLTVRAGPSRRGRARWPATRSPLRPVCTDGLRLLSGGAPPPPHTLPPVGKWRGADPQTVPATRRGRPPCLHPGCRVWAAPGGPGGWGPHGALHRTPTPDGAWLVAGTYWTRAE